MLNAKRILSRLLIFSSFIFVTLTSCGGGGSDQSEDEPEPVQDTRPDTFVFNSARDVEPAALVQSNTVTITGINTQVSVSITGGEYAIDGDSFSSEPGLVSNGQEITVQLMSSEESGGIASAELLVGEITSTFSVRTAREILRPIRSEAESSELQGAAVVTPETNASSGQVVGNLSEVNDGVLFIAPQDSVRLSLTYAADTNISANILIGNEPIATIDLEDTMSINTFRTTMLDIAILENDEVSILLATSGNASFDHVEFIPELFQVVETYAPGLTQGDGISVDSIGNIFVSGGVGNGSVLEISTDLTADNHAVGLSAANGSDHDSQDNLYVADYSGGAIWKISPDGERTSFASNLNGPAGLWINSDDEVFVSLYGANFSGIGSTVIKINPAGEQVVYATGGGLRDVVGVTGDNMGRVFAGNLGSGQLFEITNGNVEPLANATVGINMIDYARGYIYVPGGDNHKIIRVSVNTGEVETFSGLAGQQGSADAHILDATFDTPSAIAFSIDENEAFVLDSGSGEIRRIHAGTEE
jgi:hypothetical protein